MEHNSFVMATTGAIPFPAGREGRIEWRAVDGVGLTSTSGALEVWINRPPRATIDAPRDGDEIRPGVDYKLRATSGDPDGHTLNETWSSDVDGELGVGSEVLVRLSEGEHVLTLRVEDPLGGVDETTVKVVVVEYSSTEGLWWPLLLVIVVILVLLGWRFATRQGERSR